MNAETAFFLGKLQAKLENIFRRSHNQLIKQLAKEALDELREHIKNNLTTEETKS
jgi:dihydroneopterin aldolase